MSLPRSSNTLEKKKDLKVDVGLAERDETLDPLSAFSYEQTLVQTNSPVSAVIREEKKSTKSADEGSLEEVNKNWKSRTNAILLKFTTVKKVSIVEMFCVFFGGLMPFVIRMSIKMIIMRDLIHL